MTMALLVQLKWASLLLASPNPFSIGFISGEFPGHLIHCPAKISCLNDLCEQVPCQPEIKQKKKEPMNLSKLTNLVLYLCNLTYQELNEAQINTWE